MAGHPSAGSGQLLPVPMLLLQCSDRFHCGLFLRNLVMLHLELHLGGLTASPSPFLVLLTFFFLRSVIPPSSFAEGQ
jgi:hypothetical protein